MEAERFLAKNMLLRLRGADGPFPMLRMRRGDVDDIDVGIGQKRVVGSVRGESGKVGKFDRLGFRAAGRGGSSPVSERRTPRANLWAMAPVPIIPQRSLDMVWKNFWVDW
jgi:hypothetical protein